MAETIPPTSWVPIPDPTALTTDQLRREIAALHTLLVDRINHVETRSLARKEFMTELLNVKMLDRDRALEAALVNTREQAFERKAAVEKNIDQLTRLMETATGAVNNKVDELRNRMTALEAHSKGGNDAWGWIAAAIGMAWGAVSTVMILMQHVHS